MSKRNRYKDLERFMTICLIANAAIFVLYLIVAGAALGWLKILLAAVTLLMALAGLAFLFLTQELLKQRSLWLSFGFFSVFICTLVSLILGYPG